MLAALRWAGLRAVRAPDQVPVIATLVTSFKSPREIAGNPGLWIEAPTLANYAEVLTPTDRLNIWSPISGTRSRRAASAAASPLLLALPAAYAIARGGFGRRMLLPLVVNLRAVPLIIFAIPIYMGSSGWGSSTPGSGSG